MHGRRRIVGTQRTDALQAQRRGRTRKVARQSVGNLSRTINVFSRLKIGFHCREFHFHTARRIGQYESVVRRSPVHQIQGQSRLRGRAPRFQRLRIKLLPALRDSFDQGGLQRFATHGGRALQERRIAFVGGGGRILKCRHPLLVAHQSDLRGDGIK
jgi:hypothetical protein